ncbi:M60 family metallopeptidase [Chitinophaga nivalis]|uniref:M60 family metallopeptidase n=1 Tax=Chitinophaga nivalis TaxID=2991709 RepID=A0ABT3ILJ5_9BACT|nr:M60 family metallopeptidase [Chitinophaga nivalis]MCW3465498.1 M60 family metallopeptidase [Chitinophaga nivalis]MCW3484811.1 M60 family metallopeptidase [Chitinophaga nivalis]
MKKSYVLPVMLLMAATGAYAQDAYKQVRPEKVIISPAQPLSVKEDSLRKLILQWSEKQLSNKQPKQVLPHPAAAIFPGAVKPGAVAVTRTIALQHQPVSDTLQRILSRMEYGSPLEDNLYSTGLYAAPGAAITVQLPTGLLHKSIRVQIGCHTDNLGEWVAATENWRRMPRIVRKDELTNTKTTIASPFGGLVYICASPTGTAWQGDITISGAVPAPLFEAGKTSLVEWQEQLRQNKAPWGELATNNIILTLPDSILQRVHQPDSILHLWNLIAGGEMELAQLPQPAYRPQRLVIDEHLGGGYMHSGYPIMIHHAPSVGMVSADIIADPAKLLIPSAGGANWGFFHEIGHNMQNLDWVFGGTTEVSCNFFSLYMFDRFLGSREGAHTGISAHDTRQLMEKYFKAGANYDTWQNDPFLGLILFRQLQEGFGWESFKTFFRKCQELAIRDPEGNYAKTDEQKRDLWAKTFSTITGRNLAPFFETWGIPISTAVKQELAPLPGWMPYNFPLSTR